MKQIKIQTEKFADEEWEVVFDAMLNYFDILTVKKIPFDKILFNKVIDQLNKLCPESNVFL